MPRSASTRPPRKSLLPCAPKRRDYLPPCAASLTSNSCDTTVAGSGVGRRVRSELRGTLQEMTLRVLDAGTRASLARSSFDSSQRAQHVLAQLPAGYHRMQRRRSLPVQAGPGERTTSTFWQCSLILTVTMKDSPFCRQYLTPPSLTRSSS